MIDRRAFLCRLGFGTVAAAAAATGVLDLERLLWTPGEKTIFLPPTIAPLGESFTIGDVFTISGVYAKNPITCQTTDILKQFVITADVQSGNILTTDRIHPQIITDGTYQNANCSPAFGKKIPGNLVHPVSVGRCVSVTYVG